MGCGKARNARANDGYFQRSVAHAGIPDMQIGFEGRFAATKLRLRCLNLVKQLRGQDAWRNFLQTEQVAWQTETNRSFFIKPPLAFSLMFTALMAWQAAFRFRP